MSSLVNATLPWDKEYQQLLIKKVGEKLPDMSQYPFFQYPNLHHLEAKESGNGKIWLFGYGSLLDNSPDIYDNPSIKPENGKTLRPAIAFGVKRIFNWVEKRDFVLKTLEPKEKCFLNLVSVPNFNHVTNGVVIEIDHEDLAKLVTREIGYDLVPIFVASWQDAIQQNERIKIDIAYAFMASSELRNHVSYTSNEYYPIRWYASHVDKAAMSQGPVFWNMYQQTTWLGDGTTLISDWKGTFP